MQGAVLCTSALRSSVCTVYSVTPVTSTFSAVISANALISAFSAINTNYSVFSVITSNFTDYSVIYTTNSVISSDINVRWAVRWVLLKNK